MRTFKLVITTFAAGIMLGNAYGQQTPPAKTDQTAPAKAPATPAAKTTKAVPAKTPGAATTKSTSTLVLKTQKDKFSYALGMNIGMGMHQRSVEVDPNILAQGMKAALAGGKTLLTQQEAQAVLSEVQAEMQKKQQEKMQVVGEANKKEGDAFLAANKAKEGVVTLPSGLE